MRIYPPVGGGSATSLSDLTAGTLIPDLILDYGSAAGTGVVVAGSNQILNASTGLVLNVKTGQNIRLNASGSEIVRVDTNGLTWLTNGVAVSTNYCDGRSSTSRFRNVPTGVAFGDYVNGVLISACYPTQLQIAGGVYTSTVNSVPIVIRPNTTDAADNQYSALWGGGAIGTTRGAAVYAYGNEHATLPGLVQLYPGEAGNVRIYDSAGNEQVRVDAGGAKWMTNGSVSSTDYQIFRTASVFGIQCPTGIKPTFYINGAAVCDISSTVIRTPNVIQCLSNASSAYICHITSAASDDRSWSIFGGGANSLARGAGIQVYGFDHATLAGRVLLRPATGAGYVSAYDNAGAEQVRVDVNKLQLLDACDLATGTTTGSKIFAASNQKGAFWGATPIIQPTTAVAAATLAGGGGTALTDTHTFDGYTLLQVVKALRNEGLLA